MSCFGKLFGKKKRQPPMEERIMECLDHTEALLLKQQEDLERKIENCLTTIKANALTNKKTAMRALQKKKRLEKNLEQVDYTISSLDLQRDALENAKTNAAVLRSMKKAGVALKKSNSKLEFNKVQAIMEDINDQHYVGNEITTAIRRSLVSQTDDDELIGELQLITDMEISKSLIEANHRGKCPSKLDAIIMPSTSPELDAIIVPSTSRLVKETDANVAS